MFYKFQLSGVTILQMGKYGNNWGDNSSHDPNCCKQIFENYRIFQIILIAAHAVADIRPAQRYRRRWTPLHVYTGCKRNWRPLCLQTGGHLSQSIVLEIYDQNTKLVWLRLGKMQGTLDPLRKWRGCLSVPVRLIFPSLFVRTCRSYD